MKINESVYLLESTPKSHIYLIRTQENYLIDASLPNLSTDILKELQSIGVSPKDIHAILLTHHDADHISNAMPLHEATGAEVWAPIEDAPYIIGERRRPFVKLVRALLNPPGKQIVTNTYIPNQQIGDIKTYHTPGHTPGHTIFQFQDVVFCGDMFHSVEGHPQLLPWYLTWNKALLKKSFQILRDLNFEWMCPAHGAPIRNGEELQNFLAINSTNAND